MSPLMLWCSLVPWRRRRRYYFLQALDRLREQQPDESKLPDAFGATPAQFTDWLAGRSTPRLFCQTIAIIAYKVPPPSTWVMWRPVVIVVLLLALAGEAYWWNVLR